MATAAVNLIVNAETCAAVLGISPRRLHDLAASGRIQKAGVGRYDLRVVVPSYVEGLREEAAGRKSGAVDDDPTDLTLQRAKLARVQRLRTETKLAQERRVLLLRTQVEDELFRGGRVVRDNLLAIPDRVSSELAADTDAASIHRRLSGEIKQALVDLPLAVGNSGAEAG
jgi:phage terminase Nu1 subunit (DNA packaging protein)